MTGRLARISLRDALASGARREQTRHDSSAWRLAVGRLRSGHLPETDVLAFVLHVTCGAVVMILALVAPSDPARRVPVALVGATAVIAGVVIRMLPWHRWKPNATEFLIPESLVLTVAFNIAADDPYLHSLFLVVVYVWTGLTQAPGTAARWSPALAASYLIPAFTTSHPRELVLSVFATVPVCVLTGEIIAGVASKVRDEELLRARSEAWYSALVRVGHECVILFDADGQVVYANPAVCHLLGLTADDLRTPLPVDELIHPDDRAETATWYEDAVTGFSRATSHELRLRRTDGEWRWFEASVTNMLDDPAVGAVVVNARDVTDRRRAASQLEAAAFTDPLTGLANRGAVLRHLDRAICDPDANPVALIYLDLDGFKVINDSLGHDVGDQVLTFVARRLAPLVGPSGELGRLGGDEFVVVTGDVALEQLEARASSMVAALTLPFVIGDRNLRIGASVGLATSHGVKSSEELLRRADLAMYRAKGEGGSRWASFDDELADRAQHRLELEEKLRGAVARDELVLDFQPVVDLETGRIVGAEALLRWEHPELGRLGPDEFVEIAEEAGLILEIGRWVIDQALLSRARWREAGHDDLWVAVNVSAHQLGLVSFVAHVAEGLARNGLEGADLCLELTETALLDTQAADILLPMLHDLGVQVAIDDFGTGYSSLGYLQTLEVDRLKIDKTFLWAASADDRSSLLAAIIAMAHNLDLDVVTEGVETPSQLALLERLGCDEVQGFLLGRPVPNDELVEMLDHRSAVRPLRAVEETVLSAASW